MFGRHANYFGFFDCFSKKNDSAKDETFVFVKSLAIKANCSEGIGVSDSRKGSFIFSDSFGVCQAVVVRLVNGEFCIYHASLGDECEGSKKFITLLKKEKCRDIFIIQKTNTTNKTNLLKAPRLAVYLSKHLSEVKRLSVDSYQAVVCDAESKKIYITDKINYDEDIEKGNVLIPSDIKSQCIDLNSAISLKVSKEQFNLESKQDQTYFKKHAHSGAIMPVDFYLAYLKSR